MLNFEFTDEEKLFAATIREFGEKKITPKIREIDDKEEIPLDIIKGLASIGVLGVTFSKEYGGSEADPIMAGIIGEELGRADISCAIPVFYLVPAAWGCILNKYGKKEAKDAILKDVTGGDAYLGIASTEPDTGSDVANIRTTAKKIDNSTYLLNGEKMYISGIKECTKLLPKGGGYITLAKTSPDKGAKGISLFYIPINTKGITTTLIHDWGRRGISTGGFVMEDVKIPANYLIGEENKGFYLAMEGFNRARGIIAAVCCGASMRALEISMDYIKQRTAFGQIIGKFEGIQFKLAENWAKLDAVKALTYKALWMLKKSDEDKNLKFEATKLLAEAKMLAPLLGFEAINDALQWFGAFGYSTECQLDLGLKGIRSYWWAEGSQEIMKIIIARELLGKEYVAYR